MRRAAFTLIEVMAVVTLLGLLAGATVWKLAEDAQRSTRDAVIGRIARVDQMARLAAQRFGRPCTLRVDLDGQRVWRVTDDGEELAEARPFSVPTGYRINRVVTAGPADAGDALKIDSGTVEIAYSTGGRSESYGLRLAAESGPVWMVFTGLTGQMVLIHDEDEIDNLFAMLTTGRPDAH